MESAIPKILEEFQQILEATSDGIWTWNFKTNKLFFSPRYYTMLGYQADEFLPTYENWLNLIHPEDQDKTLDVVQKYFKSKSDLYENEFRLKTASGDYVWIHAQGRVVKKDIKGEPILMIGNHKDITDQKIAEIKLKESEAKYRSIMDSMDELTYICSADYHIEYMNPAMIRKLGKDASGELCYKAIFNFEKPCSWCHLKKVLKGELVKTEIIKPGINEFYFISHSPIFHADGTISKLSVYRDITEIKKLESRIQQAQKMESIGNLAGGIAHDFNNLLFPIIGMAELLMDDLPCHSQEYENARSILEAGKRGSDLVKQILAFSRQSEQKIIPVSIQKILKEVLKLSRSTIPSNIEIQQNIQQDCGLIMADSTQIHQVAMNLITNAFHAIEPESGKIKVELREINEFPENHMKSEKYILLSVSDTGHGISDDILPKIFDPYFTTKGQGKGTGLGLATVYGIVKEHRGEIKVHSSPGKGTVFNIYLPLMEKEINDKHPQFFKELPKGNERILLVDDEKYIIDLEKQMLERLGYKVTSRVNSIEALEAFKAKPDDFDIIITDMTMPNMTGDQLSKEVKKINSQVPVVVCTGFSERITKENIKASGINEFMMKPVNKSEMAYTVRKALNQVKKIKT